jgi:hypothetical protein
MSINPLEVSSSEYYSAVFSDEGPRGGWEETQNERGEKVMRKVLGAGRFGIMLHQKELNIFLKACELPEANEIQQEGFEGSIKRYCILTVAKELWDQKILPYKTTKGAHAEGMAKLSGEKESKKA